MITIDDVLSTLDYAGSEGLVTATTRDIDPSRAYVWREISEKLGVDAVYFHQNVPVVYFKQLRHVRDDELRLLHKRIWNHNGAPLLIVVLPGEARVYDCYAPPASNPASDGRTIIAKIRLITGAIGELLALDRYRREMVESAQFARSHDTRFRSRDRVDQRLLTNLRQVREDMVANGLSRPVAHSLLGRSIFVRYLEDRGILEKDYLLQFGDVTRFVDLLSASKDATYRFFGELATRFNGDMFPVRADEINQVTANHLHRLGHFLSGADLSSGQLYFWAYDFNFIPIELISSIYETFLDSDRRNSGVYYTPPAVVDYVLDQVLPWEGDIQDVRIIDPACGSGAFLVEAFRRLVMRQMLRLGINRLPYSELRSILTEHVFGIDVSADALSIAAFSCYLSLLDFVEPKSVWTQVSFPKLIGTNLYEADFFDVEADYNLKRYSIVIGNPPWSSHLTGHAQQYVQSRQYRIGDKQIAQAFLWRASDIVTPDGLIGFLAPSKGLLHNQSGPNVAFRKQFFEQHDIRAIADFTQFQSGLFANALAPMAAIFYRPRQVEKDASDEIVYQPMQLTPQSQMLPGFATAGDDTMIISKRLAISRSDIWKLALYGSPRDMALIDSLRARFPTIAHLMTERGWVAGRGFQVNGPDELPAPDYLTQLPYIETESIRPFRVDAVFSDGVTRRSFHRLPNRQLYAAPHLLMRIVDRAVTAAYVPFDASFSSPIGIAAPLEDGDALKQVCAYINSSLAQYVYFLTSSMWGVERGRMDPTEYKSLPIALLPNDDPTARKLVQFVDDHLDMDPTTRELEELDNLVFDAYGLSRSSRQIIYDMIGITLDRFRRGPSSRAFNPPSDEEMISYAAAFSSVVNEMIDSEDTQFQAVVYAGQSPMRMVSFELRTHDAGGSGPIIKPLDELSQVLDDLNQTMHSRPTSTLHVSRNVKIFDPDAVHIVKSSELRHWTASSAFRDADETIGHLLDAIQVRS